MPETDRELDIPRPLPEPRTDPPVACQLCGARQRPDGPILCHVCGEPVLRLGWAP